MKTFALALCSIVFAVPAVAFQGLNIAVQDSAQIPVPSASYSAATNQSGTWNRMVPPDTGPFQTGWSSGPLLDINNMATQVTISVSGSYIPFSHDRVDTIGDDGLLMDSGLDLGNSAASTTFEFQGLTPGTYTLYTYAMVPDSLGGTHIEIGNNVQSTVLFGTFANGFEEGVTHTIHSFTIAPGQSTQTIRTYGYYLGYWAQVDGFQLIPDGGVPAVRFCDSTVNSTGTMANLTFGGSISVQANDLQLGVANLPLNQFGYFVVSQDQGSGIIPPGSQGTLCINGNIGRHNRLGEVLFSGATGEVLLNIDLTDIPQPMGPTAVLPGETWSWQFWYRDSNPLSTSNFSDGNRFVFTN
ncbi:MAG: hypothetical protein ACI89E_000850 [Planctomycetota bacterium]|jgi:hypothetical protein